jgi:hypothetical protein
VQQGSRRRIDEIGSILTACGNLNDFKPCAYKDYNFPHFRTLRLRVEFAEFPPVALLQQEASRNKD